jgi:hypothetical protein
MSPGTADALAAVMLFVQEQLPTWPTVASKRDVLCCSCLQFYILLNDAPHLNGKHVVFGKVCPKHSQGIGPIEWKSRCHMFAWPEMCCCDVYFMLSQLVLLELAGAGSTGRSIGAAARQPGNMEVSDCVPGQQYSLIRACVTHTVLCGH